MKSSAVAKASPTGRGLSHLKQFNGVKFESTTDARQDEHCRARVIDSQLSRAQRYVDGYAIRVQLLSAQHSRSPGFGLSAHDLLNKSGELARNHQRQDFRLSSAAYRRIELRDKRACAFIYRSGGFGFDSFRARRQSGRVFCVGANRVGEVARSFGILAAPQSNTTQAKTGPGQRNWRWQPIIQ